MATSAAKELFALEDASVYRFGRYHGEYKTCETFAESAKKAKGNFIARIKAALGLDFSSNLSITGTLKNLDSGEKFEIVLVDDGYKCEVKKVVR